MAGTNLSYREQVFDETAPTEERFEQVREYCLTLRELRAEDWAIIDRINRRLAQIERAIGSQV